MERKRVQNWNNRGMWKQDLWRNHGKRIEVPKFGFESCCPGSHQLRLAQEHLRPCPVLNTFCEVLAYLFSILWSGHMLILFSWFLILFPGQAGSNLYFDFGLILSQGCQIGEVNQHLLQIFHLSGTWFITDSSLNPCNNPESWDWLFTLF